jgi:hypothetical protein
VVITDLVESKNRNSRYRRPKAEVKIHREWGLEGGRTSEDLLIRAMVNPSSEPLP